ncbi:MAG: bifunctional adenosylcobinamide kinase/adenosylcobinamide-phosphate guanylyltransferase [Halofilum sp. (in: g-proteobacteria)]|nr:bifunctional adenosylcobinamide kinase/adenosylcobinamide-phosphate guanylyltransferase [Halofilum sp. (in: g-proteobacteria)]
MRELILGGARSGKSRLAEKRAREHGGEVVYVATAEAGDGEMRARIEEHRRRRPAQWRTVEAPRALAETLRQVAAPDGLVLVDCLTLWLGNLIEDDAALSAERESLLSALPRLPGEIVLVSNEVGQGIVPDNALARRFRDEAGWLHQAVAERCERATFVVAGLPVALKGGWA